MLAARLSGMSAGAFSYVSEFHTIKRAGLATALITVLICTIWICLPVLAMLTIPMDWVISISILDFKPWRLFLICNTFVNLWNGIVFSYMPESPKFLLVKNRKEEALHVLSKMYAINTGASKMVTHFALNLRYFRFSIFFLFLCNIWIRIIRSKISPALHWWTQNQKKDVATLSSRYGNKQNQYFRRLILQTHGNYVLL